MKKIALVTGGNRGIGLETSFSLAKAGFEVILSARDPRKGKRAVAKLLDRGVAVVFHRLDITRQADIGEIKEFIEKEYGKLDLLINNAAVMGGKSDITKSSLTALREVMETNYFGPLALVQALLPLLKKSEDPRIINVSSEMGKLENLGGDHAAYRLSKFGLNGITLMLARSGGTSGIKINSVCPGWVRTDMGGPAAPRTVEEGAAGITWLATESGIPSGRFFKDRKEISW